MSNARTTMPETLPPRHARSRSGMTMVEVLMASALGVMLIAGIFAALANAEKGSSLASQHVAAFGRCREQVEQMRGAPYSYVITNNFPTENITLTHLGGTLRIPITCTRSNTIDESTNVYLIHKSITVTVNWTFRGEPMQRSVYASIYKKE